MISLILCMYVVVLVIILGYLDVKNKKNYLSKLGNVECNYWPLVGSIHYDYFRKGYMCGYDWITSEQPTGLIWLFNIPIFYTRRPEEIQIILLNRKTASKAFMYKYVTYGEDSLVVADVDIWRPRRRAMNKCFRYKFICDFVPQYNYVSEMEINKILPEMTIGGLSGILKTSILNLFFGTLGNFGTNDIHSVLEMNLYSINETMEKIIMERFASPWLYPNYIFYQTDIGKIYREIMTTVAENARRLYEYMKKLPANNMSINPELVKRNSLMNLLLNEYGPDGAKSELIMFLVAAEDTTGTAIASALLLLGMHQDIQEKVYQEVIRVLGTDGPVETEYLSKLKYVQMVINETLRLFPSILYMARQADDDIHLGGGRSIPKGTQIIVSIREIHRDKELWKDPLKFIPERFSPEEVEKRHPCCFIPFSYGSRNCIASKFAETVMKVYLANIVRKYRMVSNCKRVEDIVIPNAMFLQFPKDLKITFKKR